jgi:hypothetical protein
LEENKFKLADIFAGVIIPLILALLVYVLAVYVNVGGQHHVLGATNTIAVILVSGFAEMIILGIPLVLGLLWNKWAGGAAGFIMGGIYYLAQAGQYNGLFAMGGMATTSITVSPDILAGIGNGTITSITGSGFSSVPYNFFGDISMLFWIVYGVIIGYMAGALTNGSTNFKRMIGAGLTASVIVSILKAYLNYTISLDVSRKMGQDSWAKDPVLAVVTNFVPLIALGVIVPILGKVMTWYGIQPQRH